MREATKIDCDWKRSKTEKHITLKNEKFFEVEESEAIAKYSKKLPHLFDTQDPKLIKLQILAELKSLKFVEKMEFKNGAVYKGYVVNGIRHGPGKLVFPSQTKTVSFDNKNIRPTHILSNEIYEGEWAEDKANGYGI